MKTQTYGLSYQTYQSEQKKYLPDTMFLLKRFTPFQLKTVNISALITPRRLAQQSSVFPIQLQTSPQKNERLLS